MAKEEEAIVKEMEKYVIREESAELIYERVRRRLQFCYTAANMADPEEIKRLDQILEDVMKRMGYSESSLSLPSNENFPADINIVKQRQKKESRPFKKPKLDNSTEGIM
ncbi:hypothetical protein TNIN_184861 [Trichonephila inaurata madagascariensis]|uniref:Uncharacterized protein n=1 Tax=Trichonephila inaurata madagascariensis TaxID=2747483 RepID=A0A8X6JPW7_9ARAC|nr:hypothetical protein TNIN_184861 [Trichonephila inaurata madagascariensis]